MAFPRRRVHNYTTSRQVVSGEDMNNIRDSISGAVSGLVAAAGGGKANATPLTAHVNTIATAASAADSVQLPKGFAGAEIWLINGGANAVQVFGNAQSSDTIDGAATGTGISVAAGSKTIFKCNISSPSVSSGGTGIANWISK